jgi:D-tagatose-1,6-bisphosphate aldolase subunit GatZ/KbaZ
VTTTVEPKHDHASSLLQDVIRRNRSGEKVGVYSVCSAHPNVIDAAIRQSIDDGSILLVESTSSQVNQFGGYTGQTPAQFAEFVYLAAQRAGFPRQRVLLGGDHLGPYPWRDLPSEVALQKACDLVRACVLAGYKKIHLDASMACADDSGPALADETIARRAAILCRAAEGAYQELPPGSPRLLYVVGTEVPTPGGETLEGEAPRLTTVEQLQQTLEVFRAAFNEQKMPEAWERVIGMVVQPGVEFGENVVFAYDRDKSQALSDALPAHPALVYEAHSTDYQSRGALAQLVADHFAILKVGPWLTFAFREVIFALSAIERELLAHRSGVRLSQVREALDAAMLHNPAYWRSYYRGNEDEVRLARFYSYSDRCRYYWVDATVQEELARLRANLDSCVVPATLLSQYLPAQYEAVRDERLCAGYEVLIREHIRDVLRLYAAACGAIWGREQTTTHRTC